MPVKIRLARHGRKGRPIYHIVVADSRAPRDGKYIEKLGLYNPNTNPATIDLEFDKALDWLQKGAQPTDTCKSLLSTQGVLMKKHLLDGAKKGAFSEEEAERRFDTWLKEKELKIKAIVDKVTKEKEAEEKAYLEREAKVNEERAAELAKKKAEEEAAKAPAEEPSVEEAAPEANKAEATEEAPAEAKKDTPAEEVKEEVVAKEEKKEETPATENAAEDKKEEDK